MFIWSLISLPLATGGNVCLLACLPGCQAEQLLLGELRNFQPCRQSPIHHTHITASRSANWRPALHFCFFMTAACAFAPFFAAPFVFSFFFLPGLTFAAPLPAAPGRGSRAMQLM